MEASLSIYFPESLEWTSFVVFVSALIKLDWTELSLAFGEDWNGPSTYKDWALDAETVGHKRVLKWQYYHVLTLFLGQYIVQEK